MTTRAVAGLTLVLLVACAGYIDTSIPTTERYVYRIGYNRTLDLDEARLAQLADSWKPVAKAAEASKTQGADRVRALNMVTLYEEVKFSCRALESLQVIRKDSGFLSITHGLIHTNPSINEYWTVTACDKERLYLILGDKGHIGLYYRADSDWKQ